MFGCSIINSDTQEAEGGGGGERDKKDLEFRVETKDIPDCLSGRTSVVQLIVITVRTRSSP
jgi:hypothetical protein